jgi:hypothetical protein
MSKIVTDTVMEDSGNLKQTFDITNLHRTHTLFDISKKSTLFNFKEAF